MIKMHQIIVIFGIIFCYFIFSVQKMDCAMTMDELKQTGANMRMACKAKNPVTDEQMAAIQEGNFPDDKLAKCFMLCIMEMIKIVKKGKPQIETAMKQVDLFFPEDLKASFKQGIIACEHSADGIKDACDKAYAASVCFKQNNPQFFFP